MSLQKGIISAFLLLLNDKMLALNFPFQYFKLES